MQYYLGVEYLPVLMSSTRVAELIMLWAHYGDHAGRDTTYFTSCYVAWIVGGRKMATRVKEHCVRCRYLDMKMEGQKMAPLPDRITIPCPCFTHLGVDLAGPFQIKIRPGARQLRGNQPTIKAWVIVIVCLSTKAVKLYTAAGLSTQDFLLAYLEHT